MKKIRSRIHQFICPELMDKLDKISADVIMTDNNLKSRRIINTLDEYGVAYHELGPGTNRMAVLIDGYVFKIALDKWGRLDNGNEFAMSQELQPFVIKVYENNDLISVSEYVTLITREEFHQKRIPILKILSTLAESYLIGDVGYVDKNFANWGYRDNGELVILDFAYIHNIVGNELLCIHDQTLVEYDSNFDKLRCPTCRKVYEFIQLRKRISLSQEWEFINMVKNDGYMLLTPEITLEEPDDEQNNENKKEEETNMRHDFEDEGVIEVGDVEDEAQAYNDMLRFLYDDSESEEVEEESDNDLEEDDDTDTVTIPDILQVAIDETSAELEASKEDQVNRTVVATRTVTVTQSADNEGASIVSEDKIEDTTEEPVEEVVPEKIEEPKQSSNVDLFMRAHNKNSSSVRVRSTNPKQ